MSYVIYCLAWHLPRRTAVFGWVVLSQFSHGNVNAPSLACLGCFAHTYGSAAVWCSQNNPPNRGPGSPHRGPGPGLTIWVTYHRIHPNVYNLHHLVFQVCLGWALEQQAGVQWGLHSPNLGPVCSPAHTGTGSVQLPPKAWEGVGPGVTWVWVINSARCWGQSSITPGGQCRINTNQSIGVGPHCWQSGHHWPVLALGQPSWVPPGSGLGHRSIPVHYCSARPLAPVSHNLGFVRLGMSPPVTC